MIQPQPGRDAGSLTLIVALLLPVALLMIGLVIDGGLLLAARQRAANLAENAARAGANRLSHGELRRTDRATLDQPAAVAAARDYLRQAGQAGTVRVSDTTVTVTVTVDQRTTLMTLAAINHVTVTGTATARAVRGITGPDQ